MKKNTYFLIMFSLLSFVVINFACKKSETIKLGYGPFNSALDLFVAQERGFFKKHNLNVELVKFGSPNELMNAMIQGKIDGVQGMGFPTAFAVEDNTPGLFKMFSLLGESDSNNVTALLSLKDSPISSFADLKGKKVGTYSGTTQLVNLKVILANFMNPDKDIQIVQVDKTLEIQALLSKQFDALLTVEPGVVAALATGKVKIIVANPRGKYIIEPFPAGAHCLSTTFLKKKPKVASNLVAAIDDAIKFIRVHPQESKKTLTKFMPISTDEALKMGAYEWFTFNETFTKVDAIKRLATIYAENKILTKQLNIDEMLLKLQDLK